MACFAAFSPPSRVQVLSQSLQKYASVETPLSLFDQDQPCAETLKVPINRDKINVIMREKREIFRIN